MSHVKAGITKTRGRLVLATGALALLPAVGAQRPERVPRVGYLFTFVPAQGRHLWEACRLGLRELGYVEGRSIALEPRWAEGKHELLPGLVRDLLELKVDVPVAAATRTTPVFVAVAEPVRAGLVERLARPGGNATGVSLALSLVIPQPLRMAADEVIQ